MALIETQDSDASFVGLDNIAKEVNIIGNSEFLSLEDGIY